jgi:hypothetical protein
VQRRPDHLPKVLRAIGEVQAELGLVTHRAMARGKNDLTDAPADPGPAGLPSEDGFIALAPETPREEPRLGGLARSFGPFESDEKAQRRSAERVGKQGRR